MSKQYRTCEKCGANLDADEQCDCMKYEVGQYFYIDNELVLILEVIEETKQYFCQCTSEDFIYAHYFTEEELDEMQKRKLDKWMFAEEMLEKGCIDEII